MRALILVAGPALALAACGGNGPAGETANVDQTIAAGTIASNDITAIDAVTAEDSNIAADVPLINGLDNEVTAAANGAGPRPRPTAERPAPARPRSETPPATANSAEAATANNAL